MSIIKQAKPISTIDPAHLETAYLSCAHLLEEFGPDPAKGADEIMDLISITHSSIDNEGITAIFQRLRLAVGLLQETSGSRTGVSSWSAHPAHLPFAFLELVSSETAFQNFEDEADEVYFARDVMDDALTTMGPDRSE